MPGNAITMSHGTLAVPNDPIIPFIEGDGTGVDIWPAAQLVMDAAAAKHGKKISWMEVLAGQKAFDKTQNWLPDETVEAFNQYLVGPLMPTLLRRTDSTVASGRVVPCFSCATMPRS